MFTRIALPTLLLCTAIAQAATPPTITSVSPTPGNVSTLTSVTVIFSVPVVGVDADDLLVNTQPASSVSGGGDTYTFTFPQPFYGNVSFTWFSMHGITDLALPPNPFDASGPGATWQYTFLDAAVPTVSELFPAAGATVRTLSQAEVSFSEEVNGVDASDLLINNQPATSVSRMAGGPYVFQFPSPPNGAVNLRWAAGHGIADQALPPNSFVGNQWSYVLDPNAVVGDVVINEFLASNQTGLNDPTVNTEDPDPQPWIELLNRGSNAVNLAGWSLSDDDEFPGQWVFPSRVLQPGQHLVVFASGQDVRNPTGTNRFHTNFKLSRNGEFLGLYTPDSPRTLASGFNPTYPEQRNDTSYGRDTQGNLRYFAPPTPGGPNGNSTISGIVEPVHFSSARGFYNQPLDLVLTCETPGAVIRYTRDGSEPSALNGIIYATPLRITNTTAIRAMASRANLLPSQVITHSYLFNFSAAQRTLPFMNVVTATNNLIGRTGIIGMGGGSRASDGLYITNNPATDYHNPSAHGLAWERPVSVEYINPADNSGFQIDAGLRVQGSDWQRPRTLPTSKFSFRLYFRGDYGPGRLNYPIFPLTSVQNFDQMVLRAGFNEQINPFIRDEVIRRLSSDMGQVASHGNMAMLLLNNGPYTNNTGLVPFYNPCERVHEEMLQAHLGGGGEWDVVAPDFAASASAPGVVDGDRRDFANLMTNFWNGSAIRPITNQAAYLRVEKRLDLPNFVDYCLLNSYTAMGDWPANNWRAGRERGNTNAIWRFIAWDAEWGMGIYGLNTNRDSFAFSGTGTEDAGLNSTVNSEIARIYQALRPNPDFRLLWADRIHKHMFTPGGALTKASISNRINQLKAELATIMPNMEVKLQEWPANRPPIFVPQLNTYGLYGYSNALYGIFASSNAPAFNQQGGRVAPGFMLTMTSPQGGSIYYTTNGDDPRLRFTGAVSNSAVAYSGAIALGRSTVVKARTLLNGTNWSALAEANFEITRAGLPLRFTEIHYNPTNGPAYEFVELANIGTAPVDLSGMTLGGVTFSFNLGSVLPAGARLVLASDVDATAFAAYYPGVTVFGYFGGSLNNGGERIALHDRDGSIITSVDYKDSGGWPTASDGHGPSLEIIDPNGDPDDPANWRASANSGGSPGSLPGVPAPGDVRLNEVLAVNLSVAPNGATFPDYVELHNAGAIAANLAGWSLTDDGNARKFVFPGGTSVAAGGYLVIWCDDSTNTTPGLHAGFSLGANGSTVYLYDAGTNRVDGLSLGLQLADYSVGRVGGDWALNTPSPNAANSAATTGPTSTLSINEWLANAAPGLPDWLELYNPSTQPVALRGIYLASTTAVHQVTSLSFIGAGGFVQLFADENVGVDHLDFKLPSAGGSIILYDNTATEVNRVSYANAVEGLTRGRLPDGSVTFQNFPGSASPGASNYVNVYTGPVINEVLARNQTAVTNAGSVPDYVELFNGGASAFSLGGMSLSVNSQQAGEWIFPPAASIPAGGYLVIWCDGSRPASTNSGDFNTGESLDGESGGVYLFNASGQLVNSVEYGFQVADRSIGLNAGQWNLQSAPTPGVANTGNATLGNPNTLRINEWMANPASGPDWFELYNTNTVPVAMNGLTLTDDPSSPGLGQFRVTPLSFIGPNGFVQWIADGDPEQGRNHVNFSLDSGGETIRLYSTNGANFVLIDSVTFGGQLLDVSQGRLLDGESSIYSFAGSGTPAAPNALLDPNIVINEILTHTDPPLEDAVELFNAGSAPVNIGGWFLSNSRDNFKKYRIPDNTVIAAGGFAVFYQTQFGAPGPNAFTFNSAHGDEVWLSGADPATGRLTGYRAGANFGAAANGVSFGHVATSAGVDYAALSQRTFGTGNPGTGAPNANPLIGPVVINEIMYNPITGAEEYIELRTITASPVPLYDPANATNRWKLRDGVEFVFPANTTLAANSYALVVDFDPTQSATALATFRTRYGVPAGVPVFGPFSGNLGNGGDDVELVRPDTPQGPGSPDAGFVPHLIVDRVNYMDAAPWPSGAVDGGGLSLQRENSSAYGNEPLNWVAANPTAGAANTAGIVPPPVITTPPQSQAVLEGLPSMLEVNATGTGPLSYQWRLNGVPVPDATNSAYVLDYTIDSDEGAYDVLVSNAGGASLGGPAALKVNVPPIVLTSPLNQIGPLGTNVTFNVLARGEMPLSYQWRLNGVNIPGATNLTVSRTNVTLADNGVYDVVISNSISITIASASLTVLSNTIIVLPPIGVSVVTGAVVTASVQAFGNPLPFEYEWRRGSVAVRTNVVNSYVDYFTFNAPTNITTQIYRVIVRNLANRGTTANASFNVITLADADADGLPDEWEVGFGMNTNSAADRNLDTDGDRMSNYAEYVAGTDPTDAASYLRVDLSVVPGQASVVFNAISNKNYSVRYTDRLNSGQWFKLGDVLALTTNRVATLIDNSWTTNRFYQLVTPGQP